MSPMSPIANSFLFLCALATPAAAQVVAVERQDGRVNLIEFGANGGTPATTVLTNVEFQPLFLVGAAAKDRLRLSAPRLSVVSYLPKFIRLPGGGSIWRANAATADLILLVTRDGDFRVLLRVPHTEGRLSDRIAISPSGRRVLASNGRRAWTMDTAAWTPPSPLAGWRADLNIECDSLRINDIAAYFVADGDLYGSLGSGLAQPLALPSLNGEELVPEIVLAAESTVLLAVLEAEETQRRLVAVRPGSAVRVLTPTPGPIPLPGLAEPLGPFMAVSADGERFGWRTDGDSEELFVACYGAATRHVTTEPDYPAYLDNIGVLSFGTTNQLCFFAGDRVISGITGAEQIGAADMYAVVFDIQCELSSRNVSGTSGSLSPPFTLPGRMSLEEAVVDPLGDRFLVKEQPLEGEEALSVFTVHAAAGGPGFGTGQLAEGHEDFEFIAAGESVILVTEREVGSGEQRFLSLIPPLNAQGSHTVPFGSWSEDAEILQVEYHGTSAYVCVSDQGQIDHHWVDLSTGDLHAILPLTAGRGAFTGPGMPSSTLSLGATFDHHGRLLIGHQRPSGGVRWLRVERPASAQSTGLRTRQGFALPY